MNIDLLNWVKLHPATVHFPIAFLLLASVSGLGYLYWRRKPELVFVSWGTMVLGWIGVSAAILTGLLDQRGLPPNAPYSDILNWHISTGLAQWVLYAGLLYWRWRWAAQRAASINKTQRQGKGIGQVANTSQVADLFDDPSARWLLTLLLLAGILFVLLSGWNGGRLVFEWGVHVRTP